MKRNLFKHALLPYFFYRSTSFFRRKLSRIKDEVTAFLSFQIDEMRLTIQRVSPNYVKHCLLSQSYGTFVLRYPTENDDIIYMIRTDYQSNDESTINRYIVLSIRVDETVYRYHIQHYLLPYNEELLRGNQKQLLEPYYREQKNVKNGRFTPLKQELILKSENENWIFNRKALQDIDFGRFAGSNNAGTSKATWQFEKQHDIKVFIKSFSKDSWYFAHELNLLKSMNHFSIISFYGYYTDEKHNYLVLEDGGKSLQSCCPLPHRCPKTKMRFIANVGFQVAQAMMYLEKKKIIHRDLTAGNVLLNSYGYIKIADFGHAIKKEVGKNTLERTQSKTGALHFQFRFLAPECLPDVKPRETLNYSINSSPIDVYARFSSKSDVWSFGILLIQLMIENPAVPYSHIMVDTDIPQHVKIERCIHPRPAECPMDMYLLLQRCWSYESKDRISFTELREKMLTLETILR